MATAEHDQQRQVIWTREIDESDSTQRWRKLALYHGAPVAVALVLALALGGFGAIYGNPMAGDGTTARVIFRQVMFDDSGSRGVRHDGGPAFETVVRGWPVMPADHLDRLRETVALHVPAPIVDLDEIGA